MAKLSDEAKKAIGAIHPALVATASKSGRPNVSAKGSLRVLDDENVVFADVASPRTLANIKENPQVSVMCLDAVQNHSCRIWGTAQVITSGRLFEDIEKEFAAKKMSVKTIVKIAVEEVEVS
jgi:predicted pyridoxine 5'-phosphate oxidase superfamily flavin-nucleotide-binding protein